LLPQNCLSGRLLKLSKNDEVVNLFFYLFYDFFLLPTKVFGGDRGVFISQPAEKSQALFSNYFSS
jgi:hypothetical protein